MEEVGIRLYDCEHKTPTARESGYPYIAIPNVHDGRLDLSSVRLISQDDLTEWTRRAKPQTGDVLVTRRGRVGDTAVIPEGLECAIGQNLVLLRSDGSRVDQRFLRWAARGPLWDSEVARYQNVGAVFYSLNCRDIPKIRIPVPPLDEQIAIASVLEAIDDKIDLNQRLSRSLDDVIGLQVAMACTEGSEAPVSELGGFHNGGASTKDASGTGRMVVRIADLRSGPGPSTVYNDIAVPEDRTVRPGDILFSWSGSLLVHRWFRDEAIVNQHIFKVVPRDGLPSWLVYGCLHEALPTFQSIAAGKATTMGHINRHHLDDVTVPTPSSEQIRSLDPYLSALWDLALTYERQTLTLAALRDTLLSKLISGELRVGDAERMAEDVA